jgi:hypothetical protein
VRNRGVVQNAARLGRGELEETHERTPVPDERLATNLLLEVHERKGQFIFLA